MRAVAEGTAIRADTETESTEWVKKKRFLGKAPALLRDTKAADNKPEEHRDELGNVSFWTDRSRLGSGRTGTRVAWRYQQAWKTREVHMGNNKEVLSADLEANVEELEVALKGGQATRGRAT